MKHNTRPNLRQVGWHRGAGLVEILVLLFVMGVGMLAMAKMHTVLIRDGGTANNRAVATSLALEKLDDLRGFKWINAGQAAANGDNCVDDAIFCFDEIAEDSGGFIAAGDTVVGNTSFNIAWTCTLGDTGADCTNPSDSSTFKRVTVTVAWTDQNGGHSVALASAIAKDDSLATAFFGGGDPGMAPSYRPRVPYSPGTAPDIVAVPIVQGQVNKETSKPLPDVVSVGRSVATSFETVTYELGSPDYKQVLDDYVTVSCVCKFNAADSDGNPASYFHWDAKSKSLKIKYPGDADMVSARRGVPAVNGQHGLCSKCCRDHHDVAGNTNTALYDTARPTEDYTAAGDHKHYYYANGLIPPLPPLPVGIGLNEVTPAANAPYLESCRFLRVDGFYRLMQDWQAKDLVVMPRDNYLTNPSTLAAYQAYVRNVARYHARTDCTAAGGTGCTGISQAAPPSKSELVNRNITGAILLRQLLSRAIYIDRIYGKDAPRTLDSTYYTELATRIAANQSDASQSWLDMVPFNEVNTTLLTSWWSSNPTSVIVLNMPISDIISSIADYYGVYSRGLATVLLTGNADVHAVLLPGTSGLTGGATQATYLLTRDYHATPPFNDKGLLNGIPYDSEIGIDRHDHSTDLRLSDHINISTITTPGLTGTIRLGNANAVGYFGQVAVEAQPMIEVCALLVPCIYLETGSPIPCTISGEGNVRGFYCEVPPLFIGKVKISQATGTGAFFDHGTDGLYDTEKNNGFQAESSLLLDVVGAADAGVFWLFSPSAEVRGSVSCSSDDVCNQIQATTSAGTVCTIAGGTVTCPVTLSGGSHTWTGTVTLANKPGFSNYLSATESTCSAASGNAAKTTPSLTAGPTDMPSALTFCATAGTALAPCTLGATTVQSGESLTAYSSATIDWPGTCPQIAQTRYCTDGLLSGSYAYDTCNQVKVAPAPAWAWYVPELPTHPKYLDWNAVPGASEYKVYTCTTPNKNSLTPCVPASTPSATVATTSYSPAPGHKATICTYVRATAGGGDSEASGTFCIHQKSLIYTYSP